MQKTLNHSIASILYYTMDETISKELITTVKNINLENQLTEILADNFDEPLNNLLHKHLLINQYDFE